MIIIDAKVICLIPEYHQVKLEGPHGFHYSLNRNSGIDLSSLVIGQIIKIQVHNSIAKVFKNESY